MKSIFATSFEFKTKDHNITLFSENCLTDILTYIAFHVQLDEFLGLEEEFRSEVIRWIFRVSPSSQRTGRRLIVTQITPSKKHSVSQLRNQLRKSPETRFHAVLLFTRYFRRTGECMPIAGKNETPLIKRGRLRIVWDVAISCLALSVKFHRDFLNPLTPIYSRDFLVIAPHPMSHDDFEVWTSRI